MTQVVMAIDKTRVSTFVEGVRSKQRQYANGFSRGVVKAAGLLLSESRKIVPIDKGDLLRSSRIIATGRGFNKVAEVTYRMHYAVYVHEDPNKKHKPGKSYHFLSRPARLNRGKMREIIRKEALRK